MLRAEGGRYWSLFCDTPSCCPPAGSHYDATSSEVAATATLLGLAVLPDRTSFEEQLKPVGGISRISMGQATDRAHERLVVGDGDAGGHVGAGLTGRRARTTNPPWGSGPAVSSPPWAAASAMPPRPR